MRETYLDITKHHVRVFVISAACFTGYIICIVSAT